MVNWTDELERELQYVPRRHLRQDDTQHYSNPVDRRGCHDYENYPVEGANDEQ